MHFSCRFSGIPNRDRQRSDSLGQRWQRDGIFPGSSGLSPLVSAISAFSEFVSQKIQNKGSWISRKIMDWVFQSLRPFERIPTIPMNIGKLDLDYFRSAWHLRFEALTCFFVVAVLPEAIISDSVSRIIWKFSTNVGGHIQFKKR